jgi:hypothetical protein
MFLDSWDGVREVSIALVVIGRQAQHAIDH